MLIFNSYVKLPEGICIFIHTYIHILSNKSVPEMAIEFWFTNTAGESLAWWMGLLGSLRGVGWRSPCGYVNSFLLKMTIEIVLFLSKEHGDFS